MTTKTIARWVAIGALFLIPFLSLYVSNGMYFPFITGKNFVFRALVEVAFAAWIVLAVCDPKYRPRFSWTYVWYKSFVFWLLIADLLAVNVHKAIWSNYERMDGWVMLIHLLVFFVVLGAVLSAENLWRKWWLTFLAGSGIVSLFGIGQMLGLYAIHQSADRLDATLGNSEYLAGYLLFSIAIALWQAFETRDKKYTWLKYSLFVLAAIELVLLFATGTRGTLIALVAAGVVGSVLWVLETGTQGRRAAIAVLAVLVILVGGLFVLRDSSFVKNSSNLDRLASTFALKQALGPRLMIWNMAIQGIEERPVTGWGQEGFNYVFNKYYDPGMYGQEQWFDRAHNLFFDWAVAGGIPALILFLLVLLSAAWALYRAPVSRFERIFLLSALAGYAVQGLVVFDNLFTYIPFVAILAAAHMASSKPIRFLEKAPAVNDTRLDTLIAPGALVVGLLLVWFVNVPSVRASGDLIKALTPSYSTEERIGFFKATIALHGLAHQETTEQLLAYAPQAASDTSASEETRQEAVSLAKQEIEAELTRAPQDARLHLQYALFLRTLGDVKGAQQESATARELSPKKQTIILEQGVEAFLLQDYVAAKTYFTQAYELDTDYQDPAAYVASADIAQGDTATGEAFLQQVYGTTTVNNPLLLFAYYQNKDWDGVIATIQAKLHETNDAATGFQLASAYSEAGMRAEAIAQVRATMAAHPDAQTQQQGQAYLTQLGADE